jgi:hypothetical protein
MRSNRLWDSIWIAWPRRYRHWLVPTSPHTEVAEAAVVSAAPPAEPVKMPARANPKKSRPWTIKAPGTLFAGVQGTERNLIVVTALTSVAAVVALLSAGAISLRSLF